MEQNQIKKPNPFKQAHGDSSTDVDGWDFDSLKSKVTNVAKTHYDLEAVKKKEKEELAAKKRKRVVNGLEQYEEFKDKPGQCGCWS